jgi:hypothetical protein
MNAHEPILTVEEENLLDWCYSTLEEEHIAEAEAEAAEIAAREANAPHAYEILVRLNTKILLHKFRAEMNGGGKP